METWLVQVLRHIDRQKYQMDFLVHTTDPGAYDEEVRALGARIMPCLSPSNSDSSTHSISGGSCANMVLTTWSIAMYTITADTC